MNGRTGPPAPPTSDTRRLQRTGDFGDFEDFELVAFDDVVEVLDRHTALEALLDFLDVVLEALERFEFARGSPRCCAARAPTTSA
jgi:hypothetical protein